MRTTLDLPEDLLLEAMKTTHIPTKTKVIIIALEQLIKKAKISEIKKDGFVKSLKTSFDVIPAKAGIQCFQIVLDACLRRHDGISHFLRVCQKYKGQIDLGMNIDDLRGRKCRS